MSSPKEGTFTRGRAGFANIVLGTRSTAPCEDARRCSAMQERQVTSRRRFELPALHGARQQNPIDSRHVPPARGQIDRFLVRVPVGYSHKDRLAMLRATTPIRRRARGRGRGPDHAQHVARRHSRREDVYEYAVSLTSFTRNHPRSCSAPRLAHARLVQASIAAVIGGARS